VRLCRKSTYRQRTAVHQDLGAGSVRDGALFRNPEGMGVECLRNVFWRTKKDHVVTADILLRQITACFQPEVIAARKQQAFQFKRSLRLANRSVIERRRDVGCTRCPPDRSNLIGLGHLFQVLSVVTRRKVLVPIFTNRGVPSAINAGRGPARNGPQNSCNSGVQKVCATGCVSTRATRVPAGQLMRTRNCSRCALKIRADVGINLSDVAA
jgi:hypothetical protein